MASLVPLPRPAHLKHQQPGANASHRFDPDVPIQPLTSDEIEAIKLIGNEDARHWSEGRKWLTTCVISLMGFVSPLGSSILVPGSKYLDFDFDLQSRVVSILPVSIFVLGLGVGPFILAPMSELKGRHPIYVSTSLLFIVFNLATSFCRTYAGLNVLRFLAGAAGSAGPSLGAGSIADMFEPRERGRAQALYGLGPLMGPVLGNVIGGFIAQGDRDWRWLLFTLTIMSWFVFLFIIVFLKETYAPVLLRKKREKAIKDRLQLIKQQRPQVLSEEQLHPTVSTRLKTLTSKLKPGPEAMVKIKQAQSRPFRLLFTNPICAIFSLYLGYCYGIIFLFLTQHPMLFQKREISEDLPSDAELPTYNWNLGISGLSYIGLGVGFLASALTNVLLQDNIYRRLALTDGKLSMLLFKSPAEIERAMAEQNAQQTAAASGAMDLEKTAAKSDAIPGHTTPASPDSSASTGAATPLDGPGDEIEPSKSTKADPAATVPSWGVVPDPAATSSKLDNVISRDTADDGGKKQNEKQDAKLDALAQPAAALTTPAAGGAPSPKKGRPEYRLPLCFIGMLILPCGLFIFGWSAENETHWVIPLVGSLLVGYATILCFQTILVYLVDAFVPYSASATACAVLVRSILAAAFPIVGEFLLEGIGYGWTSSLLAFVSFAGIPVPLILFRYGGKLRARYQFHG